MAASTPPISAIIPLRAGDQADDKLMAELQKYDVEIIVSSEGTRAKSLNTGAAQATRKFLWFLHADSVMGRYSFNTLLHSLERYPARLHFFDLIFTDGGPKMMKLNAVGANFRSRILGIPFGDQGLCIRKDLFFKTGGYPEDAEYGEDHLFVWQARRHKIQPQSVGAKIGTSPRAYSKEGWFSLTLKRQHLWMKQALPEWWKLVTGK
ncbi:MAG: hypothetical protein DHS20C02_08930 [Micavibrio sp.]|nr:MAG: hypothetical protein DHS20C02_08930 [Micavibrio sp.]